MHIKTLGVLSLACFFISTSSFAYVYENDDSSFSDNAYYAPAPEYIDNNFTEPAVVESVERDFYKSPRKVSGRANYSSRLPRKISAGGRAILVDPRLHAWGAYNENGKLIRAGLATAGAKWCSDTGRPCRTKTGVFRIYSLGDSDCVSRIYPVGEGGAPMPYCMYFNGGQGLHGSYHLAEANLSHGCVRISVNDAEWLRYSFVRKGTKVIIAPY
ncbi:MAG TPA: L,D-transpeptidase [Gammaproteobacteria bacterium]|nr:L,D-transpeptidase [Gammaproteobacteria bacterium]